MSRSGAARVLARLELGDSAFEPDSGFALAFFAGWPDGSPMDLS